MLTYDVDLGTNLGWIAIVPTNSTIQVLNPSIYPVNCRFGVTSISEGFPLNPKDIIKASETLYVQDMKHSVKLIVTGD